MKISYIIPFFIGRLSLLRNNLYTLAAQTDKLFEVIIVSSSFEKPSVETISELRKEFKDLDIKIFIINPSLHQYYHNDLSLGNFCNPVLAQNIGASRATGDVIVLTSPEVINSNKNVQEIKNFFATNVDRVFCLGWVDEAPIYRIPNLLNGITATEIKRICPTPGTGARCRSDAPWTARNYFLGAMRTEHFAALRGLDLYMLKDIGYDDDEFADRLLLNEFRIQLNEEIVGLHIAHSRSYQNLNNKNKDYWQKIAGTHRIANENIDWTAKDCMIEQIL